MILNVYKPVQSLQKSPVATGGLCSITLFKIEDVQEWPSINPQTGIIDTAIQLKPGKALYIVQAAEKGRSFDEELKSDAAGPFVEIMIEGSLAGHNSANLLTLMAAPTHRWGAIVADRSGVYRLVGNRDSGARFAWKYTSGDAGTSRKATFALTWQPAMPAPIYQGTVFQITIGTTRITAGKLTLIQRFRVGDPGAPMADGEEELANGDFADKNVLVIASTQALPCDDGSGQVDYTNSFERRVEKTPSSSLLRFMGGVVHGEIIEIYAFE